MLPSGIRSAKYRGQSPIDDPRRNSLISAQIESGKGCFLPVAPCLFKLENDGDRPGEERSSLCYPAMPKLPLSESSSAIKIKRLSDACRCGNPNLKSMKTQHLFFFSKRWLIGVLVLALSGAVTAPLEAQDPMGSASQAANGSSQFDMQQRMKLLRRKRLKEFLQTHSDASGVPRQDLWLQGIEHFKHMEVTTSITLQSPRMTAVSGKRQTAAPRGSLKRISCPQIRWGRWLLIRITPRLFMRGLATRSTTVFSKRSVFTGPSMVETLG